MKILIGMNLSPQWETLFADHSVEATHWTRLGKVDATDAEIMLFAARRDLVVLTHDLDFGSILAATNGSKPSVLQIRGDDLRPSSIGAHVVEALKVAANEIRGGALVTIGPNKTRLRILPLLDLSSETP